jgi:hypothetical protein
MDFLGFIKGKNQFLEIKKIRFNPLSFSHTGSPDPDPMRSVPPAARVWLGCHWWPQAIPGKPVRPGAVWVGVWPS